MVLSSFLTPRVQYPHSEAFYELTAFLLHTFHPFCSVFEGTSFLTLLNAPAVIYDNYMAFMPSIDLYTYAAALYPAYHSFHGNIAMGASLSNYPTPLLSTSVTQMASSALYILLYM
jgi:hypothetical protein